MTILEDEGWAREAPFLLVATLVHFAVLNMAPRGAPARLRPGAAVAVDFVAAIPKPQIPVPTPEIQPAAPAPKPEPQAAPTPAPAPVKKRRAHKPLTEAQKAARWEARRLAAEKAQARMEARAEAARLKAEKLAAARAEAAQIRAEQAEADRLARAEAARVKAEKLETEKLARAAALKAKQEAAAAAARQRAELKNTLATMKEPDEKLADSPSDPDSLASGNVPSAGPIVGAAAPAADNDAVYDTQRDGYDPAGGKMSGSGAGTSWSIAGPAGNRRVLRQSLPKTPKWVVERGLELSVTIRFEVLPDGSVRPGAAIRKTSGFPEIDRDAVEAVKKWKFEKINGGKTSAWGDVTFRFLMG